MNQVSKAEEGSIREACRRAYREEGVTKNPYNDNTHSYLVWSNEESRIMIEEMTNG